jgi:hypothetical protein
VNKIVKLIHIVSFPTKIGLFQTGFEICPKAFLTFRIYIWHLACFILRGISKDLSNMAGATTYIFEFPMKTVFFFNLSKIFIRTFEIDACHNGCIILIIEELISLIGELPRARIAWQGVTNIHLHCFCKNQTFQTTIN